MPKLPGDFDEIDSDGSEGDSRAKTYSRRMGDTNKVEDPASYLWLISFTDVMALMLTFFVLLFSMSEPKKQDWAGITASMQDQFNQYEGDRFERGQEDAVSISKINYNRALKLPYLQTLLESDWTDQETMQAIGMVRLDDQLALSLPSSLLFVDNSADITDSGRKILFQIAAPLSRLKNRIEVVARSDEAETTDKWAQSLERALNAAAVLENVGYRKNIVVRGHADVSPLAQTEADNEQAQPQGQRLEIIILSDDGERPLVPKDRGFTR